MISKYINWNELIIEEFLGLSLSDITESFDWLSVDEINLLKVFFKELENNKIELMPDECDFSVARNKDFEYSIVYGCEELYASESNDTTGHNYTLIFSRDDFELTSIEYEAF